MDTKLTSKQQYELETGQPAEILIRYDSPEYLLWYIQKRLNKVAGDGQTFECKFSETCGEADNISCNYRCANYTPAT